MNAITPKPKITTEQLIELFIKKGYDITAPGFKAQEITVYPNPELAFWSNGIGYMFEAAAANITGRGLDSSIFLTIAGFEEETSEERNREISQDAGAFTVTIFPNKDGESYTVRAKANGLKPDFDRVAAGIESEKPEPEAPGSQAAPEASPKP